MCYTCNREDDDGGDDALHKEHVQDSAPCVSGHVRGVYHEETFQREQILEVGIDLLIEMVVEEEEEEEAYSILPLPLDILTDANNMVSTSPSSGSEMHSPTNLKATMTGLSVYEVHLCVMLEDRGDI